MSVKLFSIFVKSLKQNLPRHPCCRPGPQPRYLSALQMETVEKANENEEKIVPSAERTRFKRRFMKRQWEDLNPNKQGDGETEAKKTCERIKRKKMAMLLGYSGVDYHGMQRNPGVPTIEEDLLKALFEAKYITEDDFHNQQAAQFQRSSRTDKGVSAVRQVVSLKLPLEIDIEEINKRLPDCIKVFGVKRVTNRFNSKSKCNARTYSYTLPTYVFDSTLVKPEERKLHRISAEKLQKVNELLGVYKGTKSYHNFTERKFFHDPSALRYMMSFNIDKVFVHSDMEFAVLVVKGQSFMLHQIRKMIGLVIAVMRGHTDQSIMDKVFGKDKVMIPTAPGLGLVLEKVHYERYDAKFKNSHDSLTWDDKEEIIQKFKHEHIYPNIVKGELAGNMSAWLEKLNLHTYEPSDEAEKETSEAIIGDDDDDDDGVDDDAESDMVDESKGNKDIIGKINKTSDENEQSEHGNEISEIKDSGSEIVDKESDKMNREEKSEEIKN